MRICLHRFSIGSIVGWVAGLAATCTLLSALLAVIVPVGLLVLLAIVQISRMVTHVAGWVQRTNLSELGNTTLHAVNQLLARVPFLHVTVTAESLQKNDGDLRAEGR